MKTIRSLAAVLVASLALALAACGGGGGGGGSPAPTPTPTPDTTPPVLTLSTSSPASLTTTVVVTSSEQLGGNVSITLQKPDGGAVTGSTTLNQGNLGMTWTNVSGTPLSCNTAYKVTASAADLAGNVGNLSAATLTTAACSALHYTDRVVALWTNGYPYMVTKTSVTPAVNNTSYQSGAIKLSSCGVANNNPQSDGMLLLECTAASDMQRHAVKLDPVTGTLSDFAGTVPSGTTFTLAESSSTQPVSGSTSARVADGWFYKDPNVDWRLLFQPDGGTTVVVKEGTFAQDGSIRVIRAYSH